MNNGIPVRKILVLSANPKGTKPLRLDEEIREIKQGLQLAIKRDRFVIESAEAVRYRDIHRSILNCEPQIVHFSGHGAGEPGLLFEDNTGKHKLVDAEALAGLFELFADQVECVLLNACYSEIQAQAIAQHIDYVIGMSDEIGDQAAIEFAVGFYDALGAGRNVEFAYKLGCNTILMAGIPEHLTPQLLKKVDLPGKIIDTTPTPISPPQDARKIPDVFPASLPREENNSIEYRRKVEEFAADGVISEIESHILSHLQQKLRLTDEQVSEIQAEILEPYDIYKQQFTKKVAAQGYPLGEKAEAELKQLQDYYKIKDEYIVLLKNEIEQQQAKKLREQAEAQRLQQQREQQEYDNKLQLYEQELSKALKAGYPLDEFVINGLKSFQQSLGLGDEDVAPIEQRVLAPKQVEYERQQEAKKQREEQERLENQRLQAEYERQQQEAERLRQEQERLDNQRRQAELKEQEQRKSPPPAATPKPPIIQTQPFEFETAILTVKSLIEKRTGILGLFGETSTSTSCDINRSRGRGEFFAEDLGNGVMLEMVSIPGGSFKMGSPESEAARLDRESPQHNVTIQPFFMGKFAVTQEQYQAVMGENPSQFQGGKKPVESITWDNAVEFCAKISKSTRKTYRLPSEAEWEYACRAGTTTPFYFGETITTDLANYDGNYTYGSAPKGQYQKQTTDVGSFPANAFGLYDMHGNVWEWCQDNWHENYEGAPSNGTPWLNSDNNYRMLRGGSRNIFPWGCRCAFRNRLGRGLSYYFIGFRVVCVCLRTP
jgi:formylglycine-generating enzyme required for sulfatase activity